MKLMTWAIIGNFLALLAVLFESFLSGLIATKAQAKMEAATKAANPGMNQADFEEKISNERIRIRARKQTWDRRAQWFTCLVLLASSILLTGDAVMSEESNKDLVTRTQLDVLLDSVRKDHNATAARVKKIEEYLFPPPGGGTGVVLTQQVQAELKSIRESLDIMDKRIKTIHRELPTLNQRLDQLQSRIRKIEQAADVQQQTSSY